jgi:hypothetical protein
MEFPFIEYIYFSPMLPIPSNTTYVTLREEHALWVFERKLLKRIFGSKKDEITGGQRKFCDEELHDKSN